MSIRGRCTCGSTIDALPVHVGGRLTCLSCGKILAIDKHDETTDPSSHAIARTPSRPVRPDEEGLDAQFLAGEIEEDERSDDEEVDDRSEDSFRTDVRWFRGVCWKCRQRRECMPISFYSAFRSFGTVYNNFQRNSILLCRSCSLPEWHGQIKFRAFVAVLSFAIVAALIVLTLTRKSRDTREQITTSTILGVMEVAVVVYLIRLGRKYKHPAFSPDVMEKVAILLARDEITRDTGADGYFTTDEYDRLDFIPIVPMHDDRTAQQPEPDLERGTQEEERPGEERSG